MGIELERERVKQRIRERLFGVEPEPACLGRFQIRERIGSGANGVVYAALDPKLDREVAIKLLLPGAEGTRSVVRRHLSEEGRALARLSHPNVVAVHDVGEEGDEVFLAMELVRGNNLREWLGSERRSQRAILDLFRQAGTGLAAAHRAGLVHRDFKPENVLVGVDGIVRVADFGLAATLVEGEAHAVPAGTPTYMAPEQWRSEQVGPAADQYAFCVALWEALHGELPGKPGERRPSARLPRRLRRALERGLSAEPSARHASMDALLLELEPRRSSALVLALLVAIPVTVLAIGLVVRGSGSAVCPDPQERLAGVWDGERRAQISAAFSHAAFGERARSLVEPRLERYASDWVEASREACEAARAGDAASSEAFARRSYCLEVRREALRATADVLSSGSLEVVARAHELVESLPDVSDCVAPQDAPADPQARRRLLELEPRFAATEAALGAGSVSEMAGAVEGLVDQARTLAHRPSYVRALILRGRAEHAAGDLDAAISTLFEAVAAAQDPAHAALRGRAAVELARALGAEGHGRSAEALRWLELAAEAVRGVEAPADEAERLWLQAQTLRNLDRFGEALESAERSYALVERTYGTEHPRTGAALSRLGWLHSVSDDNHLGCEQSARGHAILVASLGEEHPALIESHRRVARCADLDERFDEARTHHRRAELLARRTYGERHSIRAHCLGAAGNGAAMARDIEQAERLFGEAREIFAEAGARVAEANMITHIGSLRLAAARPAEALELFEQAERRRDTSLPAIHVTTAHAHTWRGRALRALGRLDEAFESLSRALDVYRALDRGWYGSDPALVHTEIALIHLERGQPAEAVAALERATEAIDAGNDWGHLVPVIELHMARAIVESGGDHEHAFELARRARASYAARGPRAAPMVADIDAWLAAPSLSSRVSALGRADGLSVWGPWW